MAFGLFVFRCLSARTVSCETPATSMLWCVLLASNACDVRHVRHDRLNACELTFSQRTCHLCYLPLCGMAMFVHQGYEGLLCGVGYCCFEPWSMLSSSPTWQPGHRKLLNLGYLHQWRVAGVSENWSWVLMSGWHEKLTSLETNSKHPSSIFQSYASLFLVDESQRKTTSTAATQLPWDHKVFNFSTWWSIFLSVEDFQMFSLKKPETAQNFTQEIPSYGPNFHGQEAYWQLNGPGWWRTWPDNFTSAPNQKPATQGFQDIKTGDFRWYKTLQNLIKPTILYILYKTYTHLWGYTW